MDLNNIKNIAKIDKENMLDLLISFPKQCEDALFIAEHTEIKTSFKRSYSNIVFTGLGGSAIGADIVKNYISGEINIPISVNRDYTLPGFVNRDSLVFAMSYSGDTEETLSSYYEAKKRGAGVVVVTSDGKMRERALRDRDMLVVMPKGYPPRCALGYLFIPPIVILSKLGLIRQKRNEIIQAARLLDAMQRNRLAPHIKEKNTAKDIAKKLYNKFPVVYASDRLSSIAMRWRGQFAENAKALTSAHVFPEMNHNEIVGWVNPRFLLLEFVAIVLKDRGDHPRVKKRMNITKTILTKEKFNVLEVESQGKSLLERILSLVYIGDFVSFYLSMLNKVDPTPVERVVYLKKQLAK